MNLTRGQTKALASKIENTLRERTDKRKDELTKKFTQELKLNPQIKEDLTTYFKIAKKYSSLDRWSYKNNSVAELVRDRLQQEQKRIVNDQLEKENFEYVRSEEIEAELMLATIDADTVADLLKIIEKKYKIKTTGLV